MAHCSHCGKPAAHFTLIDEGRMGGYCDECVNNGVLACVGITTPADPGLTPPPMVLRVPFAMPSRD
jgi:hypothetical protein